MDSTELMIKKEFLQEADELICELDRLFLLFERPPYDLTVLDQIFRMIHTLKGSGMAAGFDQLGQFAHKVETLLALFRTKDLVPTPGLLDLLIQSNDKMMVLVKALKLDFNATVDTADLVESLLEITGPFAPEKSDTSAPAFGIFDDEAAELLPAGITKPEHGRQRHILICDDEVELASLVASFIEPLNTKITCKYAAADALELLKVEPVDLIVSDLRMPNMSGVEFIKRAKALVPTTPVIFISGFAERHDLVAMCQLGAYDFLEKPLNLERLVQSAQNALRLKQVRDSVAELSRLNFYAYMLNSKLVNALAPAAPTSDTTLTEISTCLEKISYLTRLVLGEHRGATPTQTP